MNGTPEQATTPFPWALNDGRWIPDPSARVTLAQLRSWFATLVRTEGRSLYVDGTGDDRADGSRSAPLRQISAAIARAEPGDLIVVGTGVYGYTEVRNFAGRPDAWLGIVAADGARPIIHVPPSTDNFVNVIGSSYAGIFGFEVTGDQDDPTTNGSGISVYGNSHHVAIWNNHVHDFPGGGINCFDVDGSHDLVDISFNTVHGTSRYSPNNTSGISIYAARDLTGGETLGGYGYRVVGNHIYDVECVVPFTPGGFDFVTDGNGVSVDLLDTYGYDKPVLVAGNVITGCGGRGVLACGSRNVEIVQNVAIGNVRTSSPGIDGGTDLEGKPPESVRLVDNVVRPREDYRPVRTGISAVGSFVPCAP